MRTRAYLVSVHRDVHAAAAARDLAVGALLVLLVEEVAQLGEELDGGAVLAVAAVGEGVHAHALCAALDCALDDFVQLHRRARRTSAVYSSITSKFMCSAHSRQGVQGMAWQPARATSCC